MNRHCSGILALILCLVLFPIFSEEYQDPAIQKMMNEIESSADLKFKQSLAVKIARLKTEESAKAINDLLWSFNPDTVKAGIDGVAAVREDNTLFEKMLTQIRDNDTMIEYLISRHLVQDVKYYYPYFRSYYSRAFFSSEKTLSLTVMLRLNKDETRTFLEKDIVNPQSPTRQEALRFLMENYTGNYAFARTLPKDSYYDFFRLSVFLKEGSASDLPAVFQILETNGDVQTKILAYQGVNRWGTRNDRYKVYKTALVSNDDTLIVSAITLFRDLTDEAIVPLLGSVIKNGSLQSTRLFACDALLGTGKREYIPWIIPVLRETYQVAPKKYQFSDVFVSIISLGFSEIQNRVNQNYDIRSFNQKLVSINQDLNKIAQTKNPQSYDVWLDWCILQGYTVDGINLFSRLYSSDPQIREKALNVGLKILGYKTRFDFFKIYPSLSGNERELLLEVTRQLLNKGILKDETVD